MNHKAKNALALHWTPDPLTDLKGTIRITGDTGKYVLYWGDGKLSSGGPDETKPHTYTEPGLYTVALKPNGQADPAALITFRVLPQADTQLVTVEADPDAEYTARVTFTETAHPQLVPRYQIAWTNTDRQDVLGEPGGVHTHWYGTAGKHYLQITDQLSGLQKNHVVELAAPVYDPDLTATEDTSDTTRRTVKLEVTNSTGIGRTLTVGWGDGDTETIAADIGTTATHAYPFDGDYLIQSHYTDEPEGQVKYLDVTIPFTGESA